MKKIYIGHSNKYDYINELYKPILESSLNEQYEIILPHLNGADFNSQKVIEESDLFIAEVSYASLGLGIEIGRAEIQNTKILCIYNEKQGRPSCLKHVNVDVLSYSDKDDMIKKIENYLK